MSPGAQKSLGTTLAIAILLQMIYPFAHGQILQVVTIVAIYFGTLAMLLHAYYSFGWRYASTYFIATLLFAFLVEQIGVRTGWPFGDHSFDASIGMKISDVPLVIPFVWVMLAHPILVVARRVTQHWAFIYGGAVMMAWHLFLDPQMAIANRTHWTFTSSHLPFAKELPYSNPAGWLFIGMVLIAMLHLILPRERRKQGAEFLAVDVFLAWTLIAGIFDNIVFFHRPEIALYAGIIYVLILAPYFFSRWLGQPDA